MVPEEMQSLVGITRVVGEIAVVPVYVSVRHRLQIADAARRREPEGPARQRGAWCSRSHFGSRPRDLAVVDGVGGVAVLVGYCVQAVAQLDDMRKFVSQTSSSVSAGAQSVVGPRGHGVAVFVWPIIAVDAYCCSNSRRCNVACGQRRPQAPIQAAALSSSVSVNERPEGDDAYANAVPEHVCAAGMNTSFHDTTILSSCSPWRRGPWPLPAGHIRRVAAGDGLVNGDRLVPNSLMANTRKWYCVSAIRPGAV